MEEMLFSIRKDGECLGYINQITEYGQITYTTEGTIGECNYDTLQELIYGLQGFDIAVDNFYT